MKDDYHATGQMIRVQLYQKCPDKCTSSRYGKGWKEDGTPCGCDAMFAKIYPQIKAGIPMEYINITTIGKRQADTWKRFVKEMGDIKTRIEKGEGWLIWGRYYGIGKTTFACGWLKKCLAANLEAYFLHIRRFVDIVFMFDDKAEQTYHLTRIINSPVLVIDGLGEEYTMDENKWFPKQMCGYLRMRRNFNKSTTFTSNLTPKELGSRYGAEFSSLIAGRILPFELTSKSDIRTEGAE